ncbi:hypothetical protein F4780DRAFT_732930 [Xylariomycetidae sp. FL0641]|nr:hypothetical protein F4780DRAFT_732930 [Xylariomycetidae sp. FL0641]
MHWGGLSGPWCPRWLGSIVGWAQRTTGEAWSGKGRQVVGEQASSKGTAHEGGRGIKGGTRGEFSGGEREWQGKKGNSTIRNSKPVQKQRNGRKRARDWKGEKVVACVCAWTLCLCEQQRKRDSECGRVGEWASGRVGGGSGSGRSRRARVPVYGPVHFLLCR